MGIKDKCAIVGMGCTKFGELWDKSGDDLVVEAVTEALKMRAFISKRFRLDG